MLTNQQELVNWENLTAYLNERGTRIELASPPWEGGILPVY